MIKSMTGFGRIEKEIDGFLVSAQIRSVNNRYMDFSLRIPRFYSFLEDKIRRKTSEFISRGKVDIGISVKEVCGDEKIVTLNEPLARNYIDALKALTPLGVSENITTSTLSGFSDIFSVEYKEIDEDKMFKIIDAALSPMLSDFNAMREAEGVRLQSDILSHIKTISDILENIKKRSPETVKAYRSRLETRMRELLEDTNIDESRLITETAIFADKVAIDEETVRLESHLKAFSEAVKTDKPIGKKLDFIVQEMNRETNTIGSKANDIEIGAMVVEIKSEIEKIREQIQNIE